MRFDEFQRRRASFSHNVLKNGVVLRLPEECANFILATSSSRKNPSAVPCSRPDLVSNNLLEAAQIWLHGGGISPSGVIESLEDLFEIAPQVQGFRPSDDYDTRTRDALAVARACSAVMTNISQGRIGATDEEWNDFVRNLKGVVESIDEMRGGHQNFNRWLVSTMTATFF